MAHILKNNYQIEEEKILNAVLNYVLKCVLKLKGFLNSPWPFTSPEDFFLFFKPL